MSTGRRLAALVAAVVLALALYVSTFVISYGDLLRTEDPLVRNDVARLRPTRVERVETVRGVDQLRAILREARQRRLKVSISGSRPSQGGHTYTAGGFVLDMRGFNQVRGGRSERPEPHRGEGDAVVEHLHGGRDPERQRPRARHRRDAGGRGGREQRGLPRAAGRRAGAALPRIPWGTHV